MEFEHIECARAPPGGPANTKGADQGLVLEIAHGTPDEIKKAQTILRNTAPETT
jgi:hypothetical protein